MHEQERLTLEESEFAAALRGLLPDRPELTFDRVWMEAQRRRWRTQVFIWRGVAAMLAAGLIVSLLLRPHENPVRLPPVPIEPVARAHQPSPQPGDAASERQPLPIVLTGDSYLAVRSRVMVLGINALPLVTAAKGDSAPLRPLDLAAHSPDSSVNFNFFGPLWRGGRS